MARTKTFDCVEMKRRAQAQLMAEYEARQDEFTSYCEFIEAKAKATEFWGKFQAAPPEALKR